METTEKENSKNEDINIQADALSDLPVTDEQADQTRAGGSPYLFLHCANGKHY